MRPPPDPAQRRALSFRCHPRSKYPAPSQSTFSRLLKKLAGHKVNQALLDIQEKGRGRAPRADLLVVDGKEPRHGTGDSSLSAGTVPSQFYLGRALVDTRTSEIPAARQLFREMALASRRVALAALHPQDQTGRDLVLEHGADYLPTVTGNQPTLRQNIENLRPAPRAGFPPS